MYVYHKKKCEQEHKATMALVAKGDEEALRDTLIKAEHKEG